MRMLADFHFLRPWWLLAFVPAVWLAWRIRRAGDSRRVWRAIISEHLLPYLLVGGGTGPGRKPVSWLLAGWVLTTTALAGPAWRREPALFADDTAALAVVVKVTPSMRTRDVQPDRLTRGVEKVRDLLALRPGAKTALIAYAGSVHRVLPLTRDADVINTFAGELSPEIMPVEGDAAAAALALAQDVVAKSGQPGWVLWIADAVESDQVAALARDRVHSRVPVDVLGVVGEGDERSSLERAVDALGARFVPVTPDDADVRRLVGRTSFSASAESEGGERWQDAGYWLVPPVVLMSLLSFRRGWMVRTAAV